MSTIKNQIEKKTGKIWHRSGVVALCDYDYLLMIDEYDYDLSNATFLIYCKSRGVLCSTAVIGSKRWQYFLDYTKTYEFFINDFCCSETGYVYTDAEKALNWNVILIGRAKLQDCWELFNK